MFRELYQGFFMEPNGQLEMLHIEDNFRPTQPLYGRNVEENIPAPGGGPRGRSNFGFSASGSNKLTPTAFTLILSAILSLVSRSL